MACWVAPKLAAELWKIPVAHVMDLIAEGAVLSRTDQGFTFVDIAPEGTKLSPPPAPRTYCAVTRDEMDALFPEEGASVLASEVDPSIDQVDTEDEAGPIPDGERQDDTRDLSAKSWRESRSRVSRTRRPPTNRNAA